MSQPPYPPQYGHGHQQPYVGQQGPPAPKKPRKWPWIVGGVVALFVVIGIANGDDQPSTAAVAAPPTTAPARTVTLAPPVPTPAVRTIPAAPVAPPEPAGPATTASDGTYEVGVDIEAGRYKTSGPDQSSFFPNCYWERAKDDSGEFRSIIANDNVQGPGSVTVKNGEFVKFSGGCTWAKS